MEEFEAQIPIDCLCCTSSALIAGGYLFHEETRSGKIYFYDLESMEIQDEFETSGTLDIKINAQTLYSANSRDVSAINIGSKSIIKTDTRDINTYLEINGDEVFVSDIGGRVSVYDKDITVRKVVKLGEAPIWVLKGRCKELMCGSEDGELRFVDMRTWSEHHRMKRASGVISIYEHLEYLYVGSYDEHIEIVDKRMYEVVRKVKVGGGVWRIFEKDKTFFLSCMYEGLKVCDGDLNIVKEFPTNSIAYGLASSDKELFFTSFYDKKICKLRFQDLKDIVEGEDYF
ncbi:uncharacterized protein Eint_070220 [Encephalitozoon intestinalis ATCC 50506]|uniref:WD40 domain-containing protein n=1 Tax=Encephalitozoon intestinalis (strain ATCC 50506) TaxID=876142 RepID=E0S7V1_ENCIT|nr:uncharacterized protein Eint_070220 [Encephalitozoon intestinalis ATCC 50506]ADM11786.1 hypothetical protein Eint_070220 [Encephalitozoon intestinalis ATCC 50506]UTX45534.1 hypothetical protein GPK93_07g10970 [Encephalitozoon intestinalis]